MEDAIIPLIVFTAITICILSLLYFKSRDKSKIQDTLCKAIDAGQQLSPETVKALGVKSISPTFADLRRSVLLICTGIAVIIFAQAVPDEEAPRILSGLAGFPIILGIGYYVVYRLGLKRSDH
mgnify:CR=1 FL=1